MKRCKPNIYLFFRKYKNNLIMATTSQKFREFTGEPMRDKPVEDLAGIGPVLAGRLKEQGFTKVI